MTYNIAKCFVREGFAFRDADDVRRLLDKIGALMNTENPDLVFLSEAVFECGPCPVNQVRYLAEKTGMHAYAFGANYNWGLPFYRMRSGNALLSRFPLKAREVEQLPGGQPFYNPRNNRRILWCEVTINGTAVTAGVVHNDSFNIRNNLTQARYLLDRLDGKPALLAGDFNAKPRQAPINAFAQSGLFSAEFDGPATYPSTNPVRCIDFIMAPRGWILKEHRAITSTLSDHLPVLSVFTLPEKE